MLDPLSALAVVAACVQFLDFAWKVVTRTEGIFNKTNSVAKKDELTSVSERLQELRERLARLTAVASEHEHLFRIRDECQDIESNLSEVLEELKDGRRESWDFTGHGKSRRWPSARQALQHRWGKDHLARFERRLEDIRHNLIFGILVELSRYDKLCSFLSYHSVDLKQGTAASTKFRSCSPAESRKDPKARRSTSYRAGISSGN